MPDFMEIINKLEDALDSYPQWTGIRIDEFWRIDRGASQWYLRHNTETYTHLAFHSEERFKEYLDKYQIDFDMNMFKKASLHRLLEWA
jgi:hypothetical protein